MQTKLINLSNIVWSYSKEKIAWLAKFTKRNNKDIKTVATPIITILFIFFAFTGFLMDKNAHPYMALVSKIFTIGIASSLLLYCLFDLFKSIFITPFRNIIEREKNKQ